MHKLHGSASSTKTTWIQLIALVFTAIVFCAQRSSAQDYGILPESELFETTSDSSWSLFWSKSRAIRYGSALTHCTRLYQRHIPAFPPVCHPSFGYHNPCWRQIPVDRRCQPCEIYRTGLTPEIVLPAPGSTPEAELPPVPRADLPSPTPSSERRPLPNHQPATSLNAP